MNAFIDKKRLAPHNVTVYENKAEWHKTKTMFLEDGMKGPTPNGEFFFHFSHDFHLLCVIRFIMIRAARGKRHNNTTQHPVFQRKDKS